MHYINGTATTVQVYYRPGGFEEVEAPRFREFGT